MLSQAIKGSTALPTESGLATPPRQAANVDRAPSSPGRPMKVEACERVIRVLMETEEGAAIVQDPEFEKKLRAHFERLPARYALDVNPDRAEDILNHMRMLREAAEGGRKVPVVDVRAVQYPMRSGNDSDDDNDDGSMGGSDSGESSDSQPDRDPERSASGKGIAVAKPPIPKGNASSGSLDRFGSGNMGSIGSVGRLKLAPPSFGSSPNLAAMGLDFHNSGSTEATGGLGSLPRSECLSCTMEGYPMHEITFSVSDKPKLLSQLSTVVADVGLHIREAHVFCTSDGYSLDVFLVDGWPSEDAIELRTVLEQALQYFADPPRTAPMMDGAAKGGDKATGGDKAADDRDTQARVAGSDDWEINVRDLTLGTKVASGSFGDLYKGTYFGQEVAIKVLKTERLSSNLQREFAQEVSIMRKVRHKNLVQFKGACTRAPNLCIVTEFMSGGSVYDFLHRKNVHLKTASILKVGLDVARGMDYLHRNNIIHRDLKTANLLLDENEVVKVADFGVARVMNMTAGHMTAETGTYRWMAPEVIEHKHYDHKADVFSYGIVLWEMVSGRIPHEDMSPLQTAVAVVQQVGGQGCVDGEEWLGCAAGWGGGNWLSCAAGLEALIVRCWATDPAVRPEFAEIVEILLDLINQVAGGAKEKGKGKGFFSRKFGGM
eukprot:jgi/Mesvir1/8669/Mv02609-RA.1